MYKNGSGALTCKKPYYNISIVISMNFIIHTADNYWIYMYYITFLENRFIWQEQWIIYNIYVKYTLK